MSSIALAGLWVLALAISIAFSYAYMSIDKRIRLAWQNRNKAKQANLKTDVRP